MRASTSFLIGSLALLMGNLSPEVVLGAKASAAVAQKRDIAQEERNRALVLAFSEAAFSAHDFKLAASMLAPDYIQHNPRIPNGRDAFIEFYTHVVEANPHLNSTTVRSATDGDLVFTHAKVSSDSGRVVAIVNIFRVANGKIAEHWDVVQDVPAASANANSMF